ENLRAELWKYLDTRKAHAIQFDIALDENDAEHALRLWGKLGRFEKEARHENLAAAAENSHPDEAFLLWEELAHSLIARRSRDAYRLAVKALARARRVLAQNGREGEWPAVSTALRERYPTLRALKEELDRSGL
ncbi:MAG TPA: hypothetical protein VF719_07405, partial [Abditibacteriaceae bacterium]